MSALRGSFSGARRRVAFVIALAVIFWTAPKPSAAEIQVFTATLTGAQQVPPVSSAGTGSGTVLLNAAENQITVNLSFSGLSSNVNAAHIHGPAAAGANTGVLFDFSGVTPAATSGTIPQQTFAITPAQVAELKAGLYYFNIHTTNFGGGEIRGQIGLAAVQFTTTLSGAQQVPAVSSAGTGTGTVALNAAENQLFVHMNFSGLSSNVNAAHIHGPAAAGANTGVLFDFSAVTPAATSGSIPQQTFAISAAQVADLKAGLHYFNIHTANFGNGEIRGQIGFPAITTQPANQTVTAGQNATFTVAASGAPAPSFQWQESYAGLPFTNLANGGAYSGVTTATLTVAASSGLNGYQYRAVASSSSGSATSNAATLTVTSLPTVSLDKTSLVFSAVTTGSSFSSQTSAQTVRLTQTGAGSVTWTAASTQPWLIVSPTSGSGSATLTISTQFVSGLGAMQTGNVNLVFSGAGNTAGPIGVTLNTTSTGGAPVGAFDTPDDGSTGVTGSIGVTGWAVDDIDVTAVRILRDPVAGEPAGTLVPIGNAVLIDGARPDVQALFPNSPRSSRAGWGYLMLTNFLPNLGNGTFRLTAIADDADGHSTILGTKTITCNNSAATTPFGAIDTPGQGATVSGADVTNFGWVLARGPNRADPPGGGTVRIIINGAFISNVPGGWTSRPDLTALFPAAQYPGIATALGVAGFDSTVLTNGAHTIAWIVRDNLGAESGIGSRFFTVANGALMLDPDSVRLPATGLSAGKAAATLSNAELLRLPAEGASIIGRRGFNPDTPLQAYAVRGGVATIQAEELDRIELQLARADRSDQVEGTFTGYVRVAGGLAPLPIGSALNAATGAFTWHPGVGFVGPYDLVFARWENGHAVSRQDVRIVLNAKGSNRVGPQIVIDIPASRADVVQPFGVSGWALDANDPNGPGVNTLHVWAYPLRGGLPIFLGAAAHGGARPDVAAVFGDRFRRSGYGLTVDGLAPGTYDLAVFAWSTVDNRFMPAKVVRVTVR